MRRGWPSEAVEKRYVLARALSPNISVVRSAPVFSNKNTLCARSVLRHAYLERVSRAVAAGHAVPAAPSIQPIDLRHFVVLSKEVTPRHARATARFREQASPPLAPELIEAARSGDRRASQALWERCSAVARQVARRCAVSGVDADDLSQEALLHAIESFSTLRDPSLLVNWLKVLVWRSAVHDARRARHKWPLLSGGDDPDVLPSFEALPDFQVDVRLLLALLEDLSEEERRCLWLRRGEGWRIDEIAKVTALSISTIQRRVRTAERRLMKRLRD